MFLKLVSESRQQRTNKISTNKFFLQELLRQRNSLYITFIARLEIYQILSVGK